MISLEVAKTIDTTIQTRTRSVTITGVGGRIRVTQETILYIRIVGNSLHRGLDEVEGFYGVHFLVHPSFTMHMLLGIRPTDYHSISIQQKFKSTTFGTEEETTFMSVRHTPIAEATYLSRLPLVARPARQSLMDVLHANAHLTDKELIASSVINLSSHQEAEDLLAHMSECNKKW